MNLQIAYFSHVNAKYPYGYLEYLPSINTNARFPSAFLIIFNDYGIVVNAADALKRIMVCISLQTDTYLYPPILLPGFYSYNNILLFSFQ